MQFDGFMDRIANQERVVANGPPVGGLLFEAADEQHLALIAEQLPGVGLHRLGRLM